MNLKVRMTKSLENLRSLFGDETITVLEINDIIAAQPTISERSKLFLQVNSLEKYTEEENKVPYRTKYDPSFYRNFSNPCAIRDKILSPPISRLFIGHYDQRNSNGRVPVPSKIRGIFDLKPILIPNNVVSDEVEQYLIVFPEEVWEKYEIIGYLTSKNVDRLFTQICLNIYRPVLDKKGYMFLPKKQAESAGISRNDYVTWAGVGHEVELWRTDLWKAELERAQKLVERLYS